MPTESQIAHFERRKRPIIGVKQFSEISSEILRNVPKDIKGLKMLIKDDIENVEYGREGNIGIIYVSPELADEYDPIVKRLDNSYKGIKNPPIKSTEYHKRKRDSRGRIILKNMARTFAKGTKFVLKASNPINQKLGKKSIAIILGTLLALLAAAKTQFDFAKANAVLKECESIGFELEGDTPLEQIENLTISLQEANNQFVEEKINSDLFNGNGEVEINREAPKRTGDDDLFIPYTDSISGEDDKGNPIYYSRAESGGFAEHSTDTVVGPLGIQISNNNKKGFEFKSKKLLRIAKLSRTIKEYGKGFKIVKDDGKLKYEKIEDKGTTERVVDDDEGFEL